MREQKHNATALNKERVSGLNWIAMATAMADALDAGGNDSPLGR